MGCTCNFLSFRFVWKKFQTLWIGILEGSKNSGLCLKYFRIYMLIFFLRSSWSCLLSFRSVLKRKVIFQARAVFYVKNIYVGLLGINWGSQPANQKKKAAKSAIGGPFPQFLKVKYSIAKDCCRKFINLFFTNLFEI